MVCIQRDRQTRISNQANLGRGVRPQTLLKYRCLKMGVTFLILKLIKIYAFSSLFLSLLSFLPPYKGPNSRIQPSICK